MFLCEFYQIFQNAFFAKQLRVTASTKYPFLFATSTSARKNVTFNLVYFTYFRDKHCIACEQLFVEVLSRQLWLSWFIANRAIDTSEMLPEIVLLDNIKQNNQKTKNKHSLKNCIE